MAIEGLSADLRVADVLARWPATLRYFIARRMACVGCSMAVFCSLRAVALDYRIPIEQLMAELTGCIEGSAPCEDPAGPVADGA
jgi:hybrid cluster-associated redox disulfide protein